MTPYDPESAPDPNPNTPAVDSAARLAELYDPPPLDGSRRSAMRRSIEARVEGGAQRGRIVAFALLAGATAAAILVWVSVDYASSQTPLAKYEKVRIERGNTLHSARGPRVQASARSIEWPDDTLASDDPAWEIERDEWQIEGWLYGAAQEPSALVEEPEEEMLLSEDYLAIAEVIAL